MLLSYIDTSALRSTIKHKDVFVHEKVHERVHSHSGLQVPQTLCNSLRLR